MLGKYGIKSIGEDRDEYKRRQNRAQRRKHPVYYLYNQAKFRAKQRGLEFSIDRADLAIPEVCPILGIKLETNEGKRKDSSFSIDRVDSSLGYIKGNVKVISWKSNRMKNSLSIEDCEKFISYMKNNKKD